MGILALLVIIACVIVAGVALFHVNTSTEKGSGLGKEFIYDLEELRKVDPRLILYQEKDPPIMTHLTQALGIALGPNDQIHVAGDKSIRIFNKEGGSISDISLTESPRCLAVAPDGLIYVGMKDHVEVYDVEGKRRKKWKPLGRDAYITSIAVAENSLFLADAGNRVVVRYDISGKLSGYIGKKDNEKNTPGFNVPSPHFDLAIYPDGFLRVVNPGRHRIETYTLDGSFVSHWGKFSMGIEGFCGCCNPISFAITPKGRFITCEKGLTRVKEYDPTGKFLGVVAPPSAFPEHVDICALNDPQACVNKGLDVAVDSHGRVLILDPLSGKVRIFTRTETDEK